MRPICCGHPMRFAGSTQHEGLLIESWVCDCGERKPLVVTPLPMRHAPEKWLLWRVQLGSEIIAPIAAPDRSGVEQFLRNLLGWKHMPPHLNIRLEE